MNECCSKVAEFHIRIFAKEVLFQQRFQFISDTYFFISVFILYTAHITEWNGNH